MRLYIFYTRDRQFGYVELSQFLSIVYLHPCTFPVEGYHTVQILLNGRDFLHRMYHQTHDLWRSRRKPLKKKI